MLVVLFKQKTAYEITRCLEFRRVLFRSVLLALAAAWGASYGPTTYVVQPQTPGRWYGLIAHRGQIGRASCRERVKRAVAADASGTPSSRRSWKGEAEDRNAETGISATST